MKRTVTALYETRQEAERARNALLAANLCKKEDAEIRDQTDDDAKRHHHGLGGWLSDLFGGHHDHHLYTEGLRRGHILLIAKVDDLNETRAAELMDDAAMDLVVAENTWRGEGWTPPESAAHSHHPIPLETSTTGSGRGPYASAPGSSVRAYTL
jgi:hypothetical protein